MIEHDKTIPTAKLILCVWDKFVWAVTIKKMALRAFIWDINTRFEPFLGLTKNLHLKYRESLHHLKLYLLDFSYITYCLDSAKPISYILCIVKQNVICYSCTRK